MAPRFKFHEETVGFVHETPERVFAMLDDHSRLAAHMERPTWRMGWATMAIITDTTRPRGVGTHITLRGRVFGFRLAVEEAVTRYEPPLLKEWETTEEPHLLVIGVYRMAFTIKPKESGTKLRVMIDYDRPTSRFPRLLSVLFGRAYARWCTRQMVSDAVSASPRQSGGA